jgi:bifunctional UDP-N-acetylglucosamine pyrophosphorylase/glucosamine-1-phosphate N-acetyltransferase
LDFYDAHRALGADLSALTCRVEWPGSYGRILRDPSGWLERIVEARDASAEQLAINEVNSGFYAADLPKLLKAVEAIRPENDQGEYYLTDVVEIFRANGWSAAAIEASDPMELQGVNDRRELALVQSLSRERINLSWLQAGVTMADPSTAHVEVSVRLAQDVSLGQGVVLTGATSVGAGAVIGPYACLHDVAVGPKAVIGPGVVLSRVDVPPGASCRNRPPELEGPPGEEGLGADKPCAAKRRGLGRGEPRSLHYEPLPAPALLPAPVSPIASPEPPGGSRRAASSRPPPRA